MKIDVDELITNMKTKISEILSVDANSLRGFSEEQLKAISQQAQFVAIGIKTGDITKETERFFLDGLEDMVKSFVSTIRGLLMITIEKLWNALVQVIWDSISKLTSMSYKSPAVIF